MTDVAARSARNPAHDGGSHLLEVVDLRVEFRVRSGVVRAVNGISYTLDEGETLAILGESGSGKSVSAQAIMGLIDTPPGHVTGGQIRYRGRDLLTMPEKERRKFRGASIAMVFQDALTALNPVFPVGWQIAEMYRVHRGASRKQAKEAAVALMDRVRIPSARDRVGDYPHQFSGGMRQRVMIAMALALDPDVLIADEPTTALDVTVQAQVMDLLADLQAEHGMGLVLITHDLGVVADIADRLAVMYAGEIVETGEVRSIYRQPAHPYTVGLMASIPRLDQKGGRLDPIRGAPPNLAAIPSGCPFHPRCPYVQDVCTTENPPLQLVKPGAQAPGQPGVSGAQAPGQPGVSGAQADRHSACHFAEEVLGGRR